MVNTLADLKAEAEPVKDENVPTVKTAESDFDVKYSNILKPGISHDEMVVAYDKWADTYNSDLSSRYNGPRIIVLADFYPEGEREGLKILDVAAGTGMVAVELRKLGFKNIDALEPSQGMVDHLLKLNLYGKTIVKPIGLGPIDEIVADSYDCLVVCGGMGDGHIPVEALEEMIRVVKPSGTVFNVMREEFLSIVGEYKGRLEPYMMQLEEQGLWEKVTREVVPEYLFKKNGVLFCHRVL